MSSKIRWNATYRWLIVIFVLLGLGQPVLADQEMKTEEKVKKEAKAQIDKPKQFESVGSVGVGKKKIKYKTFATETHLEDSEGKKTASIFSVAYIREGVKNRSSRPISFVFNGGPGSSSVWLHLGLLGPYRLEVPSDGSHTGAPPYHLKANPITLLRVSDLVFVDPVGTGYSRAVGDKKDEFFWDADEDAKSIAQFIRRFITKYKRWNSPKYLIGESYGTIRAALLIPHLQPFFNRVNLSGIVLVSPAMDVGTLIERPDNNVPFIVNLPSLAQAAWYHGKVDRNGKELSTFLKEAKEFAQNDYLLALFKGSALQPAKKEQIVERLHYFTGLRKEYIRQSNLRIRSYRFTKELLRDEGLVIGTHDSRSTGRDSNDNASDHQEHRPDISSCDGAYTAVFNDYLQKNLNVNMDQQYNILNMDANEKWKRPKTHRKWYEGFMNPMKDLTKGVFESKGLRIFVANGSFDLGTTAFSAEYMFNQTPIPKELVTFKEYNGGHMMYSNENAFQRLARDLLEFYKPSKRSKNDQKKSTIDAGDLLGNRN